jgi:hypothetical protein
MPRWAKISAIGCAAVSFLLATTMPAFSVPPPSAGSLASPTVAAALSKLVKRGEITATQAHSYLGDFNAALTTEHKLSRPRAAELAAVTIETHNLAVSGLLTASRLPIVFLTINRNRQWWAHGRMLHYGQRVQFAGSPLLWEFYPGQGIQLNVLGNFGAANAACRWGTATQCEDILGALIPLASLRGGLLTWEYFFSFDGGNGPWTSAMSQATAIEALAYGYRRLHDRSYLTTAARALALFSASPPVGVGVKTAAGIRYVQYTFAPARSDEVINAFLQTLIGLHTYAQISGSPAADKLFSAGDAEARVELPEFNTGAWSLYQPGVEDDLGYHELVTGFLQQLCEITNAPTYCATADDFGLDLQTPPRLGLRTHRLTGGAWSRVLFTLSKISRVDVTVRQGKRVLFTSNAQFPYGQDAILVVAPRKAGSYRIQLSATDLAGNHAEIASSLRVVAAKHRRHHHHRGS